MGAQVNDVYPTGAGVAAAGDPIEVRLQMLGDWHIGTGAGGAGNLDRAVMRDVDGLPFVPARSLRGVWRDACEQVALGLDGGAPGPWWKWVEWTFGSQPALSDGKNSRSGDLMVPEPAKFRLSAATFPDKLRPFLSDARVIGSVTTVRSGVTINRDTGAAEPDHLLRLEAARGGCVLAARLVPLVDLPDASRAILAAGASQVERVGAKRRRGLGRCEVELVGVDVDAASIIEELGAEVAPPAGGLSDRWSRSMGVPRDWGSERRDPGSPGADRDWVSVAVTIEALQPVRLPARTVGNTSITRVRVPGSVLIPVLQRRVSSPLAGLLASGDLRVGEGRLLGDGERVLIPAPRSLAVSKVGDPVVRDLFAEDPGPVRRLGADASVAVRDEHLVVAMAERTRATHNSVDDDVQRPTTTTGGVYSFDALRAGTRWRSEVMMTAEVAVDLSGPLRELDGAVVQIGASTKDDYGEARLSVGEPVIVTSAASGSVEPATLVLTADALLLDEALRPYPTPAGFVTALASALGRPAGSIEVERALCSTARIESWHTRWNLPRPSLATLAAGSVIRVRGVGSPLDPSQLERVGRLGVGERVAEGFGRFEIDPRVLTEPVGKPLWEPSRDGIPPIPGPIVLPDADPADLRWCIAVAGDALLRQVRHRAENAVHDPAARPDGLDPAALRKLSRTQLGALRSVIGSGDTWPDATGCWLDGVDGTENRKNAWPAPVRKWLRSVIDAPSPERERFIPGVLDWPDDVVVSVSAQLVPTYLGELVRVVQQQSGRRSTHRSDSSAERTEVQP